MLEFQVNRCHCHLAIFGAFKKYAQKHVRENPSVFFQNDDYQFTLNDLNSDEKIESNDNLNSFVVKVTDDIEKTLQRVRHVHAIVH